MKKIITLLLIFIAGVSVAEYNSYSSTKELNRTLRGVRDIDIILSMMPEDSNPREKMEIYTRVLNVMGGTYKCSQKERKAFLDSISPELTKIQIICLQVRCYCVGTRERTDAIITFYTLRDPSDEVWTWDSELIKELWNNADRWYDEDTLVKIYQSVLNGLPSDGTPKQTYVKHKLEWLREVLKNTKEI